MRFPLVIILLCLLTSCATSRRPTPATATQAQKSVMEAALGYAVSFAVINELMDVVDAAHTFYRTEGHWPADSSALVQFAGTHAEIPPGKYRRLSLDQTSADEVTVNFRLAPHTVQLDQQEGSMPVNLQAAAGRIGIDPFGQDSANVRVDLDDLRFATTQGTPLAGDMS
ncbi:MAG TPA: hypothetical protein VFG50_13720, partial [Rhodothermales bacterium]|nr:hypothetical protein [Rhodothermales bacterium]